MSTPFPFDPFNAEQFDALMRAPEPGVIHHNNEAIEDIAADILRREALGELPRMEYAGSPALIRSAGGRLGWR